MNNLLDFAGLLLYYAILPLLLPVQALLYVLGGIWFTCVFGHRLLMEIPHLFGLLSTATRNVAAKAQVHAMRKKLVKVPA